MAAIDVPNQPAASDINRFRATIAKHGELASVCRFVVKINSFQAALTSGIPNIFFDLMFLCETAEIPGRGLETVDARYYGPKFKVPVQSVYTDMNLTFLCRQDMLEKEFFDQWMNIIHPPNTYDFSYRRDYQTTIDIFQIANTGESTYNIQLQEAFPVNVTPMQTNWMDENWHRLVIQFAYTRFTNPVDVKWPDRVDSFSLVPPPKRADGGPIVTRQGGSTLQNLGHLIGVPRSGT